MKESSASGIKEFIKRFVPVTFAKFSNSTKETTDQIEALRQQIETFRMEFDDTTGILMQTIVERTVHTRNCRVSRITETNTEVTIPIVFICDENYAYLTAIAITSVLESWGGESHYRIIVIGKGLSEFSVQMLKRLHACVEIVCMDEKIYSSYQKTHARVSEAALIKFNLANALSDLDKVLYLDSDVLVFGDLTELFCTELADNYAGVVWDALGMKLPHDGMEGAQVLMNHRYYFNSGVMLLNLKKMRLDNTLEKLVHAKETFPRKRYMDQDAFNLVFHEQVIPLHLKYNLMKYNITRSYNFSEEQLQDLYGLTVSEVREALHFPVIMHMTNYRKPWANDVSGICLEYRKFMTLMNMRLYRRGNDC